MEQEQTENKIEKPFTVFWHRKTQNDLNDIHPSHAKDILEWSEYKLSKAPQYLGSPLKGTYQKLWKVAFGKYRAVYTINESAREVWVLCIETRDKVYRPSNIESLLRLAIAMNAGNFIKNEGKD